MKTKLLLVTTLFITALSLNAQTFTYTGSGNWTDQANWAPSYPGDDGLENPSYIINIDGYCNNAISVSFIQAQLNISGTLLFLNSNSIDLENDVFLNNGTLLGEDFFGVNSTLSGSGELATPFTGEISNVTINPGDSNSGTIAVQSFGVISSTQFIFDIYSTTDFDTVTNTSSGTFSNNNTIALNFDDIAILSNNSSFTLFTNTNDVLFNSLSLSNPNPINGFQPQLSFTGGNITVTYTDIEAPTITNCPGDLNVTADCGIYYEIPDYTATTTATDNDSATTITYTQSLPAGIAVKDGTVITITATDSAGNSSNCTFTLNITQQTLANQEAGDVVSRNIAVYPYPSKGVFTLKNTSGLLLETAQVLDAKGALIKTVDLSSYSPNKTIDLGSLSAGIYLFKILTIDGFVTKKISIE